MNDEEDNRFVQSKKGTFNIEWLRTLNETFIEQYSIYNNPMSYVKKFFKEQDDTKTYPEYFFWTHDEEKDINSELIKYNIYMNVFKDINKVISDRKCFPEIFQIENKNTDDIPYYVNLKFNNKDELDNSRIKLKWGSIESNKELKIDENIYTIFTENDINYPLYINPANFKEEKNELLLCSVCDYLFKDISESPNHYIQKCCNNCGSNVKSKIYKYDIIKKLEFVCDIMICPNYKNIAGHKDIDWHRKNENKDNQTIEIMEKKGEIFYCMVPGCNIVLYSPHKFLKYNNKNKINNSVDSIVEYSDLNEIEKKFKKIPEFVKFVNTISKDLKKRLEIYQKTVFYNEIIRNHKIEDTRLESYKNLKFEVPKFINYRDELLLQELYCFGFILFFKRITDANVITHRMNNFIAHFDRLFSTIDEKDVFEELFTFIEEKNKLINNLYSFKVKIIKKDFENEFKKIINELFDLDTIEPKNRFIEQSKRYPLIAFMELKSYIDKFNYINLFFDVYKYQELNNYASQINYINNLISFNPKNEYIDILQILNLTNLIKIASVFGLNFKYEKEYLEINGDFNIFKNDVYNYSYIYTHEKYLLTNEIELYNMFNYIFDSFDGYSVNPRFIKNIDAICRFLFKTFYGDNKINSDIKEIFILVKDNIFNDMNNKNKKNVLYDKLVKLKGDYSTKIYEWFVDAIKLKDPSEFKKSQNFNKYKFDKLIENIDHLTTIYKIKSNIDILKTGGYDNNGIENLRLFLLATIEEVFGISHDPEQLANF
jgi:hypothetical protein